MTREHWVTTTEYMDAVNVSSQLIMTLGYAIVDLVVH